MEFTKLEKKVLDPRHEKENKLMLWFGILLIVGSIAFIPYVIHITNKVEDKWAEVYASRSDNLEANTNYEAELKSLILKDTSLIQKISVQAISGRIMKTIFICVIVGASLIGGSLRSRIYINVIKKLKDS